MDAIKSKVILAIGWLIMVVALMLGPIPGPGGIPLFALGAMMVMSQSRPARRFFIRMQQRYPNFLGPVRRFMQRRKRRKNTDESDP